MNAPETLMIFLSAVIMAVSMNHLFLAIKLRWPPLHLAIFLAGITGSAYSVMIYFGYHADPSPELLIRIYRYHLIFMQASLLALLWAFSLIFNQYSKKWFVWGLSFSGILMLSSIFIPDRLLFSARPSISIAVIFGDGVNFLTDGVLFWRIAVDVSIAVTIFLFIMMIGPLMAKKTSKDHFQLLVVIFILLILGIIDHLTDLGSNNMIYLLPFGYFILFSMLSSHSLRKMVDELRARAEIILDERKFKKIFEDIPLLAVELDKTGHIKYANPFLLQITGYHEKEVLGSDWFELFVPRNSSFEVQSLFIEILSGEFHPFYQNPIMTKKHEERLISWYNVEIHDRYDKVSGSFSIGVDITDCDAENQQLKIALKEAREHISRLQAPLK